MVKGQGHSVKNNGTQGIVLLQEKWYPRKGLIIRNTHVKYQSSSTHCSNVISKVKVSERRTE